MKTKEFFNQLLPSLRGRVGVGLLLALMMMGVVNTANAAEAYAVYNNGTLTFYYDNNRSSRTGTTYDAGGSLMTEVSLGWRDYRNSISSVTFDASFANARPTGTANWFYNCSYITSITGIQYLNTSEVTDMRYMFNGCDLLTSLDVSNFNTAKVTDMNSMFEGCKVLTTLNVSNFNTAKVTDMAYMFRDCSGLTSLDVSHFNTAEVTNMNSMFEDCSGLTSLDVSNFNTAKVTNMSFIFYGCSKLPSLDVSNFNTAKVTDMRYMFYGCSKLPSLDVSNFNTANVTEMSHMFYGCSKLPSLDVSNFNTAEVTDMRYMFYGCSYLTSLDVSNFNTANVTDMSHMFEGCSKLTTIYCDNSWSPSTSTDMFTGCTKLVSQTSGLSYDSSKTDATYANPSTGYFTGDCSYAVYTGSNNTLTFYHDTQRASRPGVSYDLDKYNGSNYPYWVENADVIQHVVFDPSFSNARPATTRAWFIDMTQLYDISGLQYLNTENVTLMNSMFYNCQSLTNIDLTSFNTDKVTNMNSMFVRCTGLTSLDLSSFNTANVTKMQSMFNSCSNLRTIIVGDNWTTSAVSDSYQMFSGCASIVGRNGTRYDANHVDKEYARLDNAPTSPGYLSDINHITPITYTVQVKIENARVQITYTNNGNTSTLTCETNQNITVDAYSNVVIQPYKTYNDLGLVSVTLNGAEIIGNLTGTGTMYNSYTISNITSDVYLAFAGQEKVDVTLRVEASAPLSHFITNTFWVLPNYDENANLYANQSATYTLNKYSNFFFEMESEEDETWGITWRPAAIYVNGEDRTEDIEYDMTTYFELQRITGDTEIRVVFEPNCDFVSVVSLGPDLLWTRFDGDEQLIDCAAEHYYVPVLKNGDPVIVRTDLFSNQTPDNYDVMYMNNYGRYFLEQPDMDQGGVEITSDHKNFQFMLFPNVKDQDRVIGVYPKAPAEPEGFLQTVMRSGGGESQVRFLYELGCNEPSETINDGDCKKIYIPPYGSECETYLDFEILLKDGETFNVYRNGEKVTDLFAEGTYSADTKTTLHYLHKTTEFREVANWSIIVEVEVTEWTVVKTAEVEDAEVRVSVEGGEEETTALTDACTEIDVSNAEYAQLRVKGSASSSTYDLYLNAYDVENHKLDVIRGVRELTGLGLKEAKELVDSAPVKVMGFATRAAAEAAKATLEAIAGTQCSIKELKAAGSFVKVLRDGEDVTTDMTPDGDYLMMSIDAADLTRTTWVITTEEIINRFDTNDDGTVDISDVTKLVNKVLGKE